MSQATHYPKTNKEGGRADSESSTFLPKLNTHQALNNTGGPLGTAPADII
jgi:hypothetical protein